MILSLTTCYDVITGRLALGVRSVSGGAERVKSINNDAVNLKWLSGCSGEKITYRKVHHTPYICAPRGDHAWYYYTYCGDGGVPN